MEMAAKASPNDPLFSFCPPERYLHRNYRARRPDDVTRKMLSGETIVQMARVGVAAAYVLFLPSSLRIVSFWRPIHLYAPPQARHRAVQSGSKRACRCLVFFRASPCILTCLLYTMFKFGYHVPSTYNRNSVVRSNNLDESTAVCTVLLLLLVKLDRGP